MNATCKNARRATALSARARVPHTRSRVRDLQLSTYSAPCHLGTARAPHPVLELGLASYIDPPVKSAPSFHRDFRYANAARVPHHPAPRDLDSG